MTWDQCKIGLSVRVRTTHKSGSGYNGVTGSIVSKRSGRARIRTSAGFIEVYPNELRIIRVSQ